MGLDMYLEKRTYVQNWNHMKPEELHKVIVKKNGKVRKDIKPERITYVIEQMGYWRKANQIHEWFVQNCQNGEDNCQSAYVGREQLQELRNICEKIQANHSLAEELLPTQSGFFFGATDYNESYYQDIDDTIKILNDCLGEDAKPDGDFYYQSSW